MSQAAVVNIGAFPAIPLQFTTDSGVAIPAANNLNVFGSGGVSTSGSGSTITITVSSLAWSTISASQALVSNQGYFCISPGGALSLSLPATSALGDMIEVTLDGANSFSIIQGAGQSIRLANTSTTSGAGGSLTTNAQGDTLRMVCQTPNLKWNVISSIGNFTIV